MSFTKLFLLLVLCLGIVCNYKTLAAQKVKWVVFDFDALADTLPLTMRFINEFCIKQFNCPPIERDVFRQKEIAETITDHLASNWWNVGWTFVTSPIETTKLAWRGKKLALELAPKCMDFFRENNDEITIFEGAKELLATLVARGYKLAIITECAEDIVVQTLGKYELLPLFEGIYSDGFNSDSGLENTIKRFLESHRLNPEEVVCVGGKVRYISAYNIFHVKMISVTWGHNSRDFLKKSKAFCEQPAPVYLVDSFKDLASLFCD